MTNVFLGYPPEHIRQWIIEHSSNEPAGHEKTWIWFEGQDDYEEFDWSGEIDQQTMIAAGLYNIDYWSWTRYPVKIEIGTNVTSIGDGAFSSCNNLTSVTVPDSVISIGYNAFSYCSSLTTITIPDSVTSIGDYAFGSCNNLTSVTVPDSVTSIGDGAFNSCSGLTSITIPDSVISIGYSAFNYCSKLTSASILGFTQAQIIEKALDWYLGYKWSDEEEKMIVYPVTVTAKDGTFTLHQS